MREKAFVETGFENWQRNLGLMKAHMFIEKPNKSGQPTIEAQMSSHLA